MTTARKRWAGGIVLIAMATAATTLRADLLYFSRGGSVQAPATPATDGTLRIDVPGGPVAFDRRDFRKIVPGFSPEGEWPSRRESAMAGGTDARFAAAWWALENGLTPQAEEMLRAIHAADPAHAATSRMVAALDRLEAPGDDPDLESLGPALGHSFESARGPHVLLLHQHVEAEASERLDVLERVVRSFYLLFAAQGLELNVPKDRFVLAWFADRDDYLAFLHAEGADSFRNTLGYYHPTLGVVATYDVRSGPSQRPGCDAIAARLRGVEAMPAGERRERLEDDARRRLLLLEMERRSAELGTAAHEMVHLLVEKTGLAPRHDDFPLWLHEGLAAQFEVVRGGSWAGFGRAHDLRLPDWRGIASPPRLAPLLRDVNFGHGYRRDDYAAAWALVYYLRKSHPAQFLTFLDLLRTPDAEPRPRADRTVALFRAALGDDLPALEADWHRMMAGLKTPLEEAR